MKYNFKKVMSVLASTVMLGSLVSAATYPAPFVDDGTAMGAVVVGANSAASDWSAAIDLQQDLNDKVTSSSGTTEASVSGEAAELFSGSTKLYINDSLNAVKSSLTKKELPTVLADGSFSGNVDATITQTITLGSNPQVTYAKMPTSSDDPELGLSTSSTLANYIYTTDVTFNKAVNLTHADSEGEDITMLGQRFTIASATDTTNLVLLKEAEKINLDSDANPSQVVSVGGEEYTIELVSASDSAATLKVTDSSGASNSKEINEAASKKVQGLTLAVQTADETNLKLSASVVAGAEKITLSPTGSSATVGEDDSVLDGVNSSITGGTTAATRITVSVAASSSDADAIKSGESMTDPLFGSFKVDFAGFNIEEVSSAREDIIVRPSGDDKMEVEFTSHTGDSATIQFAKNWSTAAGISLQVDDDGRNITVLEGGKTYRNEYVVTGNEEEGHLLRVSTISNQTTGYSNDKIKFTDVFSGDSYEATLTSESAPQGTVTIGGKVFSVSFEGSSTDSEDSRFVRLDYPDSSGTTTAVVYPTISTSLGAKVAFYEPTTINLTDWDGDDAAGTRLVNLKFPDGDGYGTTLVFTSLNANAAGFQNYSLSGPTIAPATSGGATNFTTGIDGSSYKVTIGPLNYNVTSTANVNETIIYLLEADGAGNIINPALVIFEEKDDNSNYNALIVTLEAGGSSDDGIGVDDVLRTWDDATGWEATMASDSKKLKMVDLYGSLTTIDKSDSDQYSATISYPDEQVYAQIYVAAEATAISAASATTGAGGRILVVKDSEASSVSGKNLVVVGGSCINTVAASILGSDSPVCGSDFSELTNVDAGQYLIKVAASPLNADKIAMLVAGYNAEDTTSAVAKAIEGVATDVDTEQVYPISSA